MNSIIRIDGLSKTYDGGFKALDQVDLEVRRGEILALLGPNGAGKTTLIGIVCGLVRKSEGAITVDGLDHQADFRKVRDRIGLVPQELHIDPFLTVLPAVSFTRGLFGKPKDKKFIEQLLKDLSLWDKRKSKLMELSGGMKRRLMIAKALSHEPDILFLDEPTAGVDVELRRDMWELVGKMRDRGVTIVLTTHYIEEAEEMADRVAVISKGQIVIVDETKALMKKLGRKTLSLQLAEPLKAIPAELADWDLTLAQDGYELVYEFDANAESTGVPSLLRKLSDLGIGFRDLNTRQSSLEEIFVDLVQEEAS